MVTADKTDINNNGAVSTDFIGENYAYPDADYTTRAKIRQAHEDYIRGFLTFLATDPRVPDNGSIRMEPVFMILGQSAATAACLAIDDRVAAQHVDYAKLRAQLLNDGQVLAWPVK